MKNPVKGTCDLSVHQSGSVFRLFGGWHSIEIPLEIFSVPLGMISVYGDNMYGVLMRFEDLVKLE